MDGWPREVNSGAGGLFSELSINCLPIATGWWMVEGDKRRAECICFCFPSSLSTTAFSYCTRIKISRVVHRNTQIQQSLFVSSVFAVPAHLIKFKSVLLHKAEYQEMYKKIAKKYRSEQMKKSALTWATKTNQTVWLGSLSSTWSQSSCHYFTGFAFVICTKCVSVKKLTFYMPCKKKNTFHLPKDWANTRKRHNIIHIQQCQQSEICFELPKTVLCVSIS